MKRGMKAVLYGVVFLGVFAVIGAVMVGNRFRDPEVSEQPYEAGLKWDESRKLKEGLGFEIMIEPVKLRAEKAVFSIKAKSRRRGSRVTLNPDKILVVASRPAGDRPDVPCMLRGPAGALLAQCELGSYGHWDMVATLDTSKGPVDFIEKVYVKEGTD